MTRCTVCRDQRARLALEALRRDNVSYRECEAQLGIPRTVLHRHMVECVEGRKPKVKSAAGQSKKPKHRRTSKGGRKAGQQQRVIKTRDDLAAEFGDLLHEAKDVLREARERGDGRLAVAAIRQACDAATDIGEALGLVPKEGTQDNRQINVFNGLQLSELLELRAALQAPEPPPLPGDIDHGLT